MNVTASSREPDMDQEVWEGLIDSAQSGPRMMRDMLMSALAQVTFAGSDLAEKAATAAIIEILHYPAYAQAISLGLRSTAKFSPAVAATARNAAAASARRSDAEPAEAPVGAPTLLDIHIELERLREALEVADANLLCAEGIDDRERYQNELTLIVARRNALLDEIAKLEGLA